MPLSNNKMDGKKAELKNSIYDFENLFELVPCIISIQDKNYRILKHNHEFFEKFGAKVGDYCFRAYKGRNEKCTDCPLEKTFHDGLVHYSEENGLNKDGTNTYWVVRSAPVKNSKGEIIAAMEMNIDITKRIETEQQLVQASKLATLGRLASGIAHELNQPLSVIKTASSFLVKKTNNKESIQDETFLTMLNKINSNVDRASKVINHMREFSRKSNMVIEEVNLNNVLGNVFEILGQQLKNKGINLAMNIDKDLPVIMADPNRLEQVFINLLINARDAIEEKWGDIKCDPEDKKICLEVLTDGINLIVEISDSGNGIPNNIADKIFEPFFTTKEAGKGTGLGLSISHGIIDEFGGTLKLDSGNIKGTTFIIKFPVRN